MNKSYTMLLLTMMLSAGLVCAQAKSVEESGFVEYETPGIIPYAQTLSRDQDQETFWRIQNNTGKSIRIASDNDFLMLPDGADYRLDRGSSFAIVVNGKKFTTQDHVIVFYTAHDGTIALDSAARWDKAQGFAVSAHGKGLGTGLGKGFWGKGRLGWGHYRGGHKQHGQMHQGRGQRGMHGKGQGKKHGQSGKGRGGKRGYHRGQNCPGGVCVKVQ